MFHIKICGLTRPEDAAAVARAGGDALGLNFYAESPRCVSVAQARAITAASGPEVARVGVFVNAPAAEIMGTAEALSLDYVQLHGDEPPELLTELAGRQVIRAFRMGGEGLAPLAAYLQQCDELSALPAAVLVDAARPGRFGGTGSTVDWQQLADRRSMLGGLPLILAGGLTSENVAEAIETVRPAAVDTASGVEISPGVKDPEAIAQFVAVARQAWIDRA